MSPVTATALHLSPKTIMKSRLSGSRLSLHTRFALGIGVVLLPFLGVAALGQSYLLPRLIEPLEDIIRELTEEMEPVEHLQTTLLQVSMPVNDYLISADPDERLQFQQLRQRVELAFKEASPEHFTKEEERVLIKSARAEWVQALVLGEQLLGLPSPIGNIEAAQDMEVFDAHLDRAVAALDKLSTSFYHELDHDRAEAHNIRTRALQTTLAAFVLTGAISLFAIMVLARSITRPLETMRQGATKLAQGDLSHRVNISSHDEMGELAAAFNTMAMRLEADQVALSELAYRDSLTGLYNHRSFYTFLDDEFARSQRFNQTVSLLVLDIDFFKRINDIHGHLAGDAVLKELGELLLRDLRNIDRVCRYGGEEITVILPGTDIEAATETAERLRTEIEAHAFDINTGAPLHITVSIGVASWPTHAKNAESLVAAADKALYQAKNSGRNRVVRHEPTSSQPQNPA